MKAHNSDSGMFKIGDLVIGTSDPGKSVYSASGAKINNSGSSIYGSDEDLVNQQKEITDSIVRNGGKKIQTSSSKTSSKKGAKKSKNTSWVTQFPELPSTGLHESLRQYPSPPPERLTAVHFENSFGKIKAKVEHVVEHEQAFLLVFTDEDAVVFEPKTGETLVLHIQEQHESHEVYYPGVTFNSPDSAKKLMILFKIPVDTE